MIYTKHNQLKYVQQIIIFKSKHLQNIGGNKILATTKYWCCQNIGVDNTLAATKHWQTTAGQSQLG
jgi:hypothetical protein